MKPLAEMGAHIRAREGKFPPLEIEGARLRPIDYILPVPSAQVKTCVLFAGLFAEGKTSRYRAGALARSHGNRAARVRRGDRRGAPEDHHAGRPRLEGARTGRALATSPPRPSSSWRR